MHLRGHSLATLAMINSGSLVCFFLIVVKLFFFIKTNIKGLNAKESQIIFTPLSK